MTSGRELYAAERARQQRAQARKRPADPQTRQSAPAPSPVPRVCMCGDAEVVHEISARTRKRTSCTVATWLGGCGCTGFRLAHWFGPGGDEVMCQLCRVHVLDVAAPCPGIEEVP